MTYKRAVINYVVGNLANRIKYLKKIPIIDFFYYKFNSFRYFIRIKEKIIYYLLFKETWGTLNCLIKISPFKFASAEIVGGLGNQLFQIANTLAYSLNYSFTPIFKKIKKAPSMVHSRSVYWSSVFRKIPVCKKIPEKLFPIKEERVYKFIPPPNPEQITGFKFYNGIIFKGYFQSLKYFEKFSKFLLKFMLSISSSKLKYLTTKYSKIWNKQIISISIHIRRGDYINISEIFNDLTKTDYYKKSISYFLELFDKNKVQFIVFSDDKPWSEYYLKKIFSNITTIFPKEKDYLELFLMSCCQHHIIANSSFSWWGAYLNTDPEKIVIAPKGWCGIEGPSDWGDLYLDEWVRL